MSNFPSQLNFFMAGEVVTGVTNMVTEIAKYKHAITELEVQRQQIHQQAQAAIHQINKQFDVEMKRIDVLQSDFKKMLKQNQQLIGSAKQNRQNIMQALQQILLAITQCQDVQQSQMLSQLYHATLNSLNQSGQEMMGLAAQLHDTHQQFGVSVSRRDRDWRDVS